MGEINRRRFLQLAGGGVAATMLSDSIARAATIPANRATRSLQDVEHIVVLMQENRSFDHYFGVLRGVRGFGDPHPVTLPSGRPVWSQSDGTTVTEPFRPDVQNLALTFIEDLDHSWDGTHEMFDNGAWDAWIPAKTTTAMAHMERADLPFHYALADAFTVCDGYHCSMLGPTDPNRYYMWTGWDGNDGRGGGPVIGNDELGYSWTTYPERLLAAGVSWKIYQDAGKGLDAAGFWGWTKDAYIGNYGDNSLLYFDNYRNAAPHSPLYAAARTGTHVYGHPSAGFFDELERDVRHGNLPSVSWIVAPEAYTEHPAWPAGYGAWYTAGVLNALTSDPDVWSRTALLITFDENDGFFDHVVGAYPNVGGLPGGSTVSTENEMFDGTAGTPGGSGGVPGPYGLGVRVPLLVVSPWSTGGYVCSETFDHTSLIRFIEARFGVAEPNITPWRRAVCGDLTSAFDFTAASDTVPPLPSVADLKPTQGTTPPDYHPVPPAAGAVPTQEAGTRPSRRLGYRFDVAVEVQTALVEVQITNPGPLGIGIQARSLTIPGGPFTYTVGAGDTLNANLPHPGAYDLSLHGPHGFFRHLAGSPATRLGVATQAAPGSPLLTVTLSVAAGSPAQTVTVADAYGASRQLTVEGSASFTVDTTANGGWYDLAFASPEDPSFAWTVAGRLESSVALTSDPQLGPAA
jgi:phospholipase C